MKIKNHDKQSMTTLSIFLKYLYLKKLKILLCNFLYGSKVIFWTWELFWKLTKYWKKLLYDGLRTFELHYFVVHGTLKLFWRLSLVGPFAIQYTIVEWHLRNMKGSICQRWYKHMAPLGNGNGVLHIWAYTL